jgi:hypothetical protein
LTGGVEDGDVSVALMWLTLGSNQRKIKKWNQYVLYVVCEHDQIARLLSSTLRAISTLGKAD